MKKNLLITGSSGFLGRHVLNEFLKYESYQILSPNRKELDLLNIESVLKYFSNNKPDYVIHMAGSVGGIGANMKNPGLFFYENMQMGLNIIETSHRYNIQKFILLSTVCSYPLYTPVPFKESDIWKGYPEVTNAPYGIAKKSLMVMGDAYRQQYGMNFVTLIPVNMAGEYDHFDLQNSHVIPALIRKVQTAIDNNLDFVEVWSDGTPSREFLYAGDCATAIRLCLESNYSGESGPVNIGTGKEITIKNLIEIISLKMGFKGEIRFQKNLPGGQPRRCLDISKAKEFFGFESSTSLWEIIDRTVDYWNSIKKEEKNEIIV